MISFKSYADGIKKARYQRTQQEDNNVWPNCIKEVHDIHLKHPMRDIYDSLCYLLEMKTDVSHDLV